MQGFATISGMLLFVSLLPGQERHDHGVPERLGTVSFPISCAPAVQPTFNRGVALLHSFAYGGALEAFQTVAAQDPACAMAHWGEAMTFYHPVWPQTLPPGTFEAGRKEIQLAERLGSASDREQRYIQALATIFEDRDQRSYHARAERYEQSMEELATHSPKDAESQVFFALALLGSASPADRTHTRQKRAVAILQPLFVSLPDHPGIAHYLIHACDSEELASQGTAAARAYAAIAPSAPHALHMPSHIFTRLGLWDDSVNSNLASRQAAKAQGDLPGELHAMDYLVYAYLQSGHEAEAGAIVADAASMRQKLDPANFGSAYAATAIPIRYAVERERWKEAAAIVPLDGSASEIAALAVWSKGLGLAHSGLTQQAPQEAARLSGIAKNLRLAGNDLWARQTDILAEEVAAWNAEAEGRNAEALAALRSAADQEDALEKLPVTPGTLLPAREQLAAMLLARDQPTAAMLEYRTALRNAPRRRAALEGLAKATARSKEKPSAAQAALSR